VEAAQVEARGVLRAAEAARAEERRRNPPAPAPPPVPEPAPAPEYPRTWRVVSVQEAGYRP